MIIDPHDLIRTYAEYAKTGETGFDQELFDQIRLKIEEPVGLLAKLKYSMLSDTLAALACLWVLFMAYWLVYGSMDNKFVFWTGSLQFVVVKACELFIKRGL